MFAQRVTKGIVADMYVCRSISKEEFLNLTYRELRTLTGIEIKNWSEWFNKKADPKFGTLEKIAADLGMSPLEFVEAFMERRSRTMERNGLSDA